MSTDKRRAAARRRAWGRGPMILRFEPLEDRQLLSGDASPAATLLAAPAPDLATSSITTTQQLEWGDTFQASGTILNQGTAPVNGSFKVDFFASATPNITANSVLLGETEIGGGLLPNQKAPFSQTLSLPKTAIPGIPAGGPVYVGMVLDPNDRVGEANRSNNYSQGTTTDAAKILIAPKLPASLQSVSLNLPQGSTSWGGTIPVNAAFHNDGPGDAPATRARVVLTPTGFAPGTDADVTIGNLNVPAVAAGQTVSVSQQVTLPGVPPLSLVGGAQYTLSVAPDADFATNKLSPHVATHGMGFDMAQLSVATPSGYDATKAPRADLQPTVVTVNSTPLSFGQTFTVSATIQNVGQLDSSPYRVRFLLVGSNGSLAQGLFLGDAQLGGLKAGYSQNVLQTLKLPATLPNGQTLNAAGVARIALQIDPEHVLDESSRGNNAMVSAPFHLQVVGQDGTTTPATTTTGGTTVKTGVPSMTPAPSPQPVTGPRKVKKVLKKNPHTFEHNLSVFPKNVVKKFKSWLHIK